MKPNTVWMVSSEHEDGYRMIFANQQEAEEKARSLTTSTGYLHEAEEWCVL